MLIAVSGGHHSGAVGAVDTETRFSEFPTTFLWAQALVERMPEHAVLVPPGSLQDKIAFINRNNVDVAVEIHFNSSPGGGCGSETLYCPGSKAGKLLAESVQRRIGDIVRPNRGVKEGWYRMVTGGTPDYFLAKTSCPAIIVEPEFVQNPYTIFSEGDLCLWSISAGIKDFFYVDRPC